MTEETYDIPIVVTVRVATECGRIDAEHIAEKLAVDALISRDGAPLRHTSPDGRQWTGRAVAAESLDSATRDGRVRISYRVDDNWQVAP